MGIILLMFALPLLSGVVPGFITMFQGFKASTVRSSDFGVFIISYFVLSFLACIVPYLIIMGRTVAAIPFVMVHFIVSGSLLGILGLFLWIKHSKVEGGRYAFIASASFFVAPLVVVTNFILPEGFIEFLGIQWSY